MCDEKNAPCYSDLGKCARDVYMTGYGFERGGLKFTYPYEGGRIAADAGLSLGQLKEDPSGVNISGSIFGKYHIEKYGCASAKFTKDGPLHLTFNSVPLFTDAFSIGADYLLNPQESVHTGKVSASYECDKINSQVTISKIGEQKPELLSSLVLKIKTFFLGFATDYSWENQAITRNDAALYVEHGRAGFHFRCVRIPHEFGMSAFYQVNDEVQLAANGLVATTWGAEPRTAWTLGLGAKYKLDENSFLRAKIDRDGILATSLQFKILEGLKLTLGFAIDAVKPLTGQSKVGVGIDVNV